MAVMDALAEAIHGPDYEGGSIVNLTASIISAGAGEPRYPVLNDLDVSRFRNARHLVLVVIDGLGSELLGSCHGANSLQRHLTGTLTSVYPPTTATAVTTFLTGLAPQQHGLTGWFMFMRALGTVVTILPFTTRLGAVPLTSVGVTAARLLAHPSVFDSVKRTGFSVAPAAIAHSEFNRSHCGDAQIVPYRTLDEFFGSVERAVKGAGSTTFTYAYWSELDRLAHVHAPSDERVHAHIRELDARFEEFVQAMRGSDTLIVVTADHGFVDTRRTINIEEHPELKDTLALPLCGEPRTAYCYVEAPRQAAFLDYVTSELGECVVCAPSAALLEGGYFGPGPAHPEIRSRIGDYVLLMKDGCAITDRLPGEGEVTFRGVHGGGSRAEMVVPLIVVEA